MTAMTSGATAFSGCVLLKAATRTKNGDAIISGPVASEQEDFDGEVLERSGIWKGLQTYQRLHMPVDYEHQYSQNPDPKWMIGEGVCIKSVDGRPWLSTRLFMDNPLAQRVFKHVEAGRRAGYSIEGMYGARDAGNPRRVLSTVITCITVSLNPKGMDQQMIAGGLPTLAKAITKAITTGSASVNEASTGGAALRRESLLSTRGSNPRPDQRRCPDCGRRNHVGRDRCRECGRALPCLKSLVPPTAIAGALTQGASAFPTRRDVVRALAQVGVPALGGERARLVNEALGQIRL